MDTFSYVDIFATKALEYLLVIVFLVALMLFWRAFRSATAKSIPISKQAQLRQAPQRWFAIDDNACYHLGHGWVIDDGNLLRVGIDDFAQKLLGPIERIELPQLGATLTQGKPGWHFAVAGRRVPVLAPISGEVVAVNHALLAEPQTLNNDTDASWLIKLIPTDAVRESKSLLPADLARTWAMQLSERLQRGMAGELGVVLQDGGLPLPGFARALNPKDWFATACQYLLIEPDERE
ncbi:MAG: hypothetical protein H6707_12570 [Deltaproteobacteria bacterium]|nr:hypothetical protein [Deltaproteobacteria bacterium]